MELIKKKCKLCNNERKFVKGSPRDEHGICGECWWTKVCVPDLSGFAKPTEDELSKVRELLQEVQN